MSEPMLQLRYKDLPGLQMRCLLRTESRETQKCSQRSVAELVIPERWLHPGALLILLPRDHRRDVWVHAPLPLAGGLEAEEGAWPFLLSEDKEILGDFWGMRRAVTQAVWSPNRNAGHLARVTLEAQASLEPGLFQAPR